MEKLSDTEKEIVKRQVEEYHRYASLIQNGLYYRLSNPFQDETASWEFVSEDRSEVLLNVVLLEIHGNMTVNYVRLKGLKSGRLYQDQKSGKVYSADALMEVGVPLPLKLGEYQTYQYYFRKL